METLLMCDSHAISIDKSELHDGSWLLGQKYIVGHHNGPTLGSFEAVFFWNIKTNRFSPPVLQNTQTFTDDYLHQHESQFWAKFSRRFGRFSSSSSTMLGANSRKTERKILNSCIMKSKLDQYAKEVAIMTSEMCGTFVSTLEKIHRRCLTDVAGVKPLQFLHESRRKKMKQKMELRMDILEQRFDLDAINSYFEAENKSFWQDYGLQVDMVIMHENRKFCYNNSKRRHQKQVECELPVSALVFRVKRAPKRALATLPPSPPAPAAEPVAWAEPVAAPIEDNHSEFFQGMSNAIFCFMDVFGIEFELSEEPQPDPEIEIEIPPEVITVLPPIPSTPRSRKASISSRRLSDTSISRLEDTDSIVDLRASTGLSLSRSRKNSFASYAGKSYDSLPSPTPLSAISDYCSDYDADEDDNAAHIMMTRHVAAALGRGRSSSTSGAPKFSGLSGVSGSVASSPTLSLFADTNNVITV